MSDGNNLLGESDPVSADTCTQFRAPSWRKRPAAEDYVDKEDRKRVDRRSETPKNNGTSNAPTSSDSTVNENRGQLLPTSTTDVN